MTGKDAIEDLVMTPAEGGTRLRLRVKPGSRSAGIVGTHGGALKVAVTAAPEKGKANRAVVECLSRILGIPRKAVRIVSGETSRNKVAWIGLPPERLRVTLRDLPP